MSLYSHPSIQPAIIHPYCTHICMHAIHIPMLAYYIHPCIHLCIQLFMYSCIHPFIHIYPSILPSTHPPNQFPGFYLSYLLIYPVTIHQPIHLSIHPSTYPPAHTFIHIHALIYLPTYSPIHLCIHLPRHPLDVLGFSLTIIKLPTCQILADNRNLERNRTQKGTHGPFQCKAMVVMGEAETKDKRPEAKKRKLLAPKFHRSTPWTWTSQSEWESVLSE